MVDTRDIAREIQGEFRQLSRVDFKRDKDAAATSQLAKKEKRFGRVELEPGEDRRIIRVTAADMRYL